MTEDMRESGAGRCTDTTPGELRREILVALYCLAWAITFVGAMYLVRSDLLTGSPIAWLVAALPSVAAVWMLVTYTRFLRQLDELQRLIQLEAMGWGFGGGFFAICGYLLFEPLGAPEVEAATFASVLPVLYAFGVLAGRWRYR